MSPLDIALFVTCLVGVAAFGIAMGVIGGLMAYRWLATEGHSVQSAATLAVLAGIVVWGGGWIVLLPHLLVREARRRLPALTHSVH
jgi:hypothetical protein